MQARKDGTLENIRLALCKLYPMAELVPRQSRVLRRIYFDSIYTREDTVAAAEGGTFQWMIEAKDWLTFGQQATDSSSVTFERQHGFTLHSESDIQSPIDPRSDITEVDEPGAAGRGSLQNDCGTRSFDHTRSFQNVDSSLTPSADGVWNDKSWGLWLLHEGTNKKKCPNLLCTLAGILLWDLPHLWQSRLRKINSL